MPSIKCNILKFFLYNSILFGIGVYSFILFDERSELQIMMKYRLLTYTP